MQNMQSMNERVATLENEVKGLKESRDEAKTDIRDLQKTVWRASSVILIVNSVVTIVIAKMLTVGFKLP